MSELSLTSDQQIIPAGAAIPYGRTSVAQGNLMDRARAIWAQPAFMKALPALGLIGLIALSVIIWLALQQPAQRDLFRGLPDAEKASVTDLLQKNGIKYTLDDNSGAIQVSNDDYHQAKIYLAAQGLPASAPEGSDMVSAMPIGASRAVENEQLRSAREMDLARTIEAMDSIISARVHLAQEVPSVFVRDRSEPTASVMITMSGASRLPDSQVQAIVHLIASSVPGLSADQVSVVDQNGRLLSGNSTNGIGDLAQSQLEVQGQVEQRYRQILMALLTPMLGAENFTAEVTAEMDFSQQEKTSERFPDEQSKLTREEGNWSSDKGEKQAYGIPGALSNQPPEDGELSDEFSGDENSEQTGKKKDRTSEQYARQFELGREIAVTKTAVGTVKRLSVAVAMRSPVGKKQRSKEELAAVDALVKGAIGYQAERGDTVAIEARAFQNIEEPVPAWWESAWTDLVARNLSALVIVLLLVFGIGRPLVKSLRGGSQALSKPDRATIAQEVSRELAATPQFVDNNRPPVSLDMITAASGYEERAGLIRNFVRQNPDHAAMVVKSLIAENANQKEPANG